MGTVDATVVERVETGVDTLAAAFVADIPASAVGKPVEPVAGLVDPSEN